MKNPPETLVSDLLILADGTIYAHNLTPVMAGLLAELNPSDKVMQNRGLAEAKTEQEEMTS